MIRNNSIGWVLLLASAALLAIPNAQSKPRAAKKKAQGADPNARKGGALAGSIAALAGLLMLKRKKRTDTE